VGKPLARKIIESHLVDGKAEAGSEIGIKVDRALMQDATGTMACLQFEALDIPRVKNEFSIIYVDHNMLQVGFENPDDHKFLETFGAKHGIYYSKPGNGICHQVNLERFSMPGRTLLGSDSHTPTSGGAGMLAIGVGGLDVAVAMGGAPFYFKMPKVVGVKLTGTLHPWVSTKDIILEMLRRLTVKGGLGRVFEYYGPGIANLNVPARSTVTNMGAELGATTSIFPSDDVTLDYFRRQGREGDWSPMLPDADAAYDEDLEIDLGTLEPMIACPGAPDNVKKVSEVEGTEAQQVLIGSCTNSSFQDLMVVAAALKGRKISPHVTMAVNPGSRQVLATVEQHGGLSSIVLSGARLLENACNGCIGMGSAPGTDWVSVRSFNRNWPGRSGTVDDKVYLTSPEVCVATALNGSITDPRKLGDYPRVQWPEHFVVDDTMVLPPVADGAGVEVVRGPNIKPLPRRGALGSSLAGEVLIRVGDNISTDAIMPAGAKVLPLRSNIPAISEYVFAWIDGGFVKRAKEKNGGFIVGGGNYGQGSSREHAALAPMYLGVKAVFAKSFARIHRANLINFGILPLEFIDLSDYDRLPMGTAVSIAGVVATLQRGDKTLGVSVPGGSIDVKVDFTPRDREILVEGGLLNYTKAKFSSSN
jgi:aconitate hydratase